MLELSIILKFNTGRLWKILLKSHTQHLNLLHCNCNDDAKGNDEKSNSASTSARNGAES